MSQNLVTSHRHTITVHLNFSRNSHSTTLIELEEFCAKLRHVGGEDKESIDFSQDLSPRLASTVRLPIPVSIEEK